MEKGRNSYVGLPVYVGKAEKSTKTLTNPPKRRVNDCHGVVLASAEDAMLAVSPFFSLPSPSQLLLDLQVARILGSI